MSSDIYYSLRSHSPYQGTIQVVELDGFRALSQDGITWRVSLRASGGQRAVHSTWRADRDQALETGQTLPGFDTLCNHPPTPFSLVDTLELWLLDAKTLMPLALLRSLAPDREPPSAIDTDWIAGFRDDESFYAPSLAAVDGNRENRRSHIAHTEVLTRCIRAEAGTTPHTQWFYRRADGGGIGDRGVNLDPGMEGRRLDAAAFPRLLLREHWDNGIHEKLVEEYHQWQAPYLLTHTNLSRDTRSWLERAACRQAERLYAMRRLLPVVLDRELIDTALVEATIRRTAVA